LTQKNRKGLYLINNARKMRGEKKEKGGKKEISGQSNKKREKMPAGQSRRVGIILPIGGGIMPCPFEGGHVREG